MNGNRHAIRRTLQLLLVTVAAAIAGPTALAGGGPAPTNLGSSDARDRQLNVNVPTPFARGCADFGLVFYLDTCVSHPNARVTDTAYEGDYMFRDFFRGMHWQGRGS